MGWHLWLIAAVALFIAEVFTSGFFLACFGAGAMASAVASLLTPSLAWQTAVFCLATLVSFVAIRPVFIRRVPAPRTNIDAYQGREAVIIEAVSPARQGKARLGGEIWNAEPSSGETLAPGERVVVDSVTGLILQVRKLPNKEEPHEPR